MVEADKLVVGVQIVTVGTMVVVASVVVAHRIDYFVVESFANQEAAEEIAEMIALEFVAVLEFQHLVGRLRQQ